MTKEEFLKKNREIRMRIHHLSSDEKNNPEHPYYMELEELKKEYALSLLKERESEIDGKHKRR